MVQNLQVLNIREYPLSSDGAFWKFLVQSAFQWCWWYNLCLGGSLVCNSLAPPAFPAILSIWSSDSWPPQTIALPAPLYGAHLFSCTRACFSIPCPPFYFTLEMASTTLAILRPKNSSYYMPTYFVSPEILPHPTA